MSSVGVNHVKKHLRRKYRLFICRQRYADFARFQHIAGVRFGRGAIEPLGASFLWNQAVRFYSKPLNSNLFTIKSMIWGTANWTLC